jgi:asparagine synthetase A
MLDSDVTKNSDTELLLKDNEWDLIKELARVLEPFEKTTAFMCKDKDVSVSEIYPIISGLLQSRLNFTETDSPIAAHVKETLTDELVRRFKPSSEETARSVPILASLLDPRHKKLSFLPKHLRTVTAEALESRMDDVPLRVIARETPWKLPPNAPA